MNELQTIKKGLTNIVERVKGLEIVDHDTAGDGTDLLAMIKMKYQKMEDTRKEMTKPILESKRNIDAKFKKEMEPLVKLSNILKLKLLEYHKKQEKELGEETANRPSEKVRTEDSQMVVRKDWSYEITDVDKVPREYMLVSDQAVKAMIKEGVREIPGLRIFKRSNVFTKRI